MASDTLKKITSRAKQIRKGSKNMTWKTAVKKAGAEYRAGKTVKRKPAKVARKKRRIGAAKKTTRVKTVSTVKRTIGRKKLSGKMGSTPGAVANVAREVHIIALYMRNIPTLRMLAKGARARKDREGYLKYQRDIAYNKKALAAHRRNLTQLKKLL